MAHDPGMAAIDAVDVILRDGGTLRLRPPARSDEPELIAFFGGLSPQSLFERFHGFREVDGSLVAPLLEPDWVERGALAGWLERDGTQKVVAVGSYTRIGGSDTAEMAFAVADADQGRGIGTRLLEQLSDRARAHGIDRFAAEVLAANSPALAVFGDAGFPLSREADREEVELRFPLAPTAGLRTRVEGRDHTGVVASLRPFFEPRSVAVVGASRRRGSIGGELFRNLLAADFAGAAFPVNRSGEPVAGVRAYRSVSEIDEPVDLAVICLPGGSVLEAAADALEHGVSALCVISAGFAETGADGRERQERLLEQVRAHGARLVGPNCLGIAVPGLGLNATFAPRALPAGSIGFSSQSGALGLALLERASEAGLGFSSFVSIGNKADVSSNDLLEWWEDDEGTSLVLLYLESFGNPRAFSRIARRVAQRKPILALKSGATGAGSRAAGSHTAALAGSETAVDALFRQAGVIRVGTLEEFVDAAAVLSGQPLPAGPRVAVLTNAGGLGILCADACEQAGLELPPLAEETRTALAAVLPAEASIANPVDLLGSATPELYEAAIGPVLRDPNVDALIVIFVPPVVAGADDVAAAMCRAVGSGAGTKAVVAAVISAEGIPVLLRDQGSPVTAVPYPESAAKALAIAAERARWLERSADETAYASGIDRAAARAVVESALAATNDRWLGSREIRSLLAVYGIPVVAEEVAHTSGEAVEAAARLGYPVVVKTAVPGAHKTESGGVAVDLTDAETVRSAVERIGAPVLVQPFLAGRTELLAGVVQDPVFGPIVGFGPGGALAELIGDAGFRLTPLTRRDAEELVATGKAGRLVEGFRGAPAADRGALVDLVVRLGLLADDLPELAELDLNPVLADPRGCVAVDARIRLRTPETGARLKGW
jgi:acetyl coenzyme A synthetase (ADP forming)-like protein